MSETQGPEGPAPTLTKAATVLKLLSRRFGATLPEITETTGWQPHTARAHLTRLRQSGRVLERIARKEGPAAYKIVRAEPSPAPGGADVQEQTA